jgi:hypothetical protein
MPRKNVSSSAPFPGSAVSSRVSRSSSRRDASDERPRPTASLAPRAWAAAASDGASSPEVVVDAIGDLHNRYVEGEIAVVGGTLRARRHTPRAAACGRVVVSAPGRELPRILADMRSAGAAAVVPARA